MKIKTHSGAKKRFKKTSGGKFKVGKAAQNHRMSGKSKKQKRGFRRGYDVPATLKKVMSRLMPNW